MSNDRLLGCQNRCLHDGRKCVVNKIQNIAFCFVINVRLGQPELQGILQDLELLRTLERRDVLEDLCHAQAGGDGIAPINVILDHCKYRLSTEFVVHCGLLEA